MDIGSIFLIFALLIPVVIFISRPLIERSLTSANHKDQDISTLLASLDQVVATISELDDDYTLGKIPSDSYPAQRLALLQNGADILRQIDTIRTSAASDSAEARLEAAVATQRQGIEANHSNGRKNGNAVPPVPDDDLEQRIASRRRSMQEKAAGFCPKCGRPVQVNDHFCPKCGASLV